MVQFIACVQASCQARESVSSPYHYNYAMTPPPPPGSDKIYLIAINHTLQSLQLHPFHLHPHALDPPSEYPSAYRLGAQPSRTLAYTFFLAP